MKNVYESAVVFHVGTAADFILGNKVVDYEYDIRTQTWGTVVIDNQ